MARAINKLIDHWVKTKGRRKTMTYDLGDGETLEVWWSPWTLGDMDRVFHGNPPGAMLTPKQCAAVIAGKAEDKEGRRLFGDIEEIEILNEMDPILAVKIATAIHINLDLDARAAIPDPTPGEPPPDPKA